MEQQTAEIKQLKDANTTLSRDQNEQISHLKGKETKLVEEIEGLRQQAETKDREIEKVKGLGTELAG